MKIDTLHFLVHPGAALAREKRYGSEIPFTDADMEREKELLEVYREKVDGLGEEDVLVLFSPSYAKEYRKDIKAGEEWIRLQEYAKEKLRNRCIVLTHPDFLDTTESLNRSESLDRVLGIMDNRGFDFSLDMPTEVWGTAVDGCVIKTVDSVFKQFQLTNYPIIPVKATEKKDLRSEEIAALEVGLRVNYPKAKLVDRL